MWVDGIKSRRIRRIPHERCAEQLNNSYSVFIRNSGLICLTDFEPDVEIKGNYLADQFFYIRLKLELCPEYSEIEDVECAPLEEIKSYLDGLYINMAIFKVQFSIGGDLESAFALKKTIDDKLYFPVSTKKN